MSTPTPCACGKPSIVEFNDLWVCLACFQAQLARTRAQVKHVEDLILGQGLRLRRSETMETEEHRTRHIELHRALDELVADFMQSRITWGGEYLPSKVPLTTLMHWSHTQTQNPEDVHNPREAGACLHEVLDEQIDRLEKQALDSYRLSMEALVPDWEKWEENTLGTKDGIEELAKIARLRKGGPTDFFCTGCGDKLSVTRVTCGKCKPE